MDASQVPDEIINPGYSNEDLKKESLRDIAANTELPIDKPSTDKVEEEEVTIDEVAQKAADQAAKAVLEAQDAKDKADADAKAVAEEAAKIPKTEEEKYQEYADEFTKEHGRTPTWTEVATKMEENAIAKLDARQAAKQAEQADLAEKAKQAQELEYKQFETVLNEELADAYEHGKLTRIKDPNNPSDQGLVEKNELIRQWTEVNKQRKLEGKNQIISATQILNYYYKKPNAQPAGADAPISTNRGSTKPPSEEQEYTYADLKRPWSWIARNRK